MLPFVKIIVFLVNRANILARFVQNRAIFWFIFCKMLHLGQKRQKWPTFRLLHYCVKRTNCLLDVQTTTKI